jgi:VWFA-related protein
MRSCLTFIAAGLRRLTLVAAGLRRLTLVATGLRRLTLVAAGLQPRGQSAGLKACSYVFKVCGCVLLIAEAGLLAEQTPQATFRATSHLIVQTVSVRDKEGKPIEGLTTRDFILTEDGVVQEIAFAEYERLNDAPASSLPAVTVRSDPSAVAAASNIPSVVLQSGISIPAASDPKYRDRRLLILYIDLSNLPFFDKFRVFESAEKFIAKNMTVADLVAIMSYESGRVIVRQDFTDDRPRLLGVLQALTQAAEDKENGLAFTVEPGGAFGEDDATFNMFATDRKLAALQTAVTNLAPLPEVKTLIYMGSGLSLNADNMAQLRATVNAAVRANVTINPIDTRGLVAEPPMGDATQASRGGIGMFNGTIALASTTRQQQSQDTYYALAKDTGGKAMFDNNDLSMGIAQAARAVTGYYILGYYTKNPAPDGKYRRVKVTLANDLMADVSYRPGYYGDKVYAKFNATEKERQLEDALRLEDPITDIPMAMELNYFQVSGAEYFVPISVAMPGSELTRLRPAGDARAQIDMIGEIKDEYGVTMRNMRDKLEFTLDPATAGQVARRPIHYEVGFTLLPGRYVIKLLARDATTGRIGTFQRSFVIPNLDREQVRLPISTVVLTSQRVPRASALYTVQQKIPSDIAHPLVFEGQQLVPSVTRTFSVDHTLFVFLQAYERDPPPPEATAGQAPASPGATAGQAPVSPGTTARQVPASMRPLVAFVTFYREGGKVFETEPLGIREGLDAKTGAVPVRFTIPPGSVQPGDYECQVTVLDPTTGRAAFWRAPIVLVR